MRKTALTREEIAHLLHGYASAERGPGTVGIDLANPLALLSAGDRDLSQTEVRLSRDDESLQPVQHRWTLVAEALSQHFSAELRATVRIELQSTQRSTTGQFLLGCGNPTFLVRLETGVNATSVWISIGLPLVFSLVERLLGGRLAPHQGGCRALTELEKRLSMRLVQSALTAIHAGWPVVQPSSPSPQAIVSRIERDWLNETSQLATSTFDLQAEEVRGVFLMAVPWEYASEHCPTQKSADGNGPAADSADVTATVSAIIARTRIPECDLRALAVGDLIPTEQRHDQPVQVAVDGRIRFLARPGNMEGHKAIRIE